MKLPDAFKRAEKPQPKPGSLEWNQQANALRPGRIIAGTILMLTAALAAASALDTPLAEEVRDEYGVSE